MSRITPVAAKKRKLEDAMRGKTSKPRKRIKKQKAYHSSSEDEQDQTSFVPVSLGDSEDEKDTRIRPSQAKKGKRQETVKPKKNNRPDMTKPESDDEEEPSQNSEDEYEDEVGQMETETNQDEIQEDEGDVDGTSSSDAASEPESNTKTSSKPKSKRNDPSAFSTSISKILSTKVPSRSADPVLAHSREAAQSRAAEASSRLEAKATSRLRAEKAAALQKGRIRDPSGVDRGVAGQVAQEEKELRRIAQRGVVQLFNAFRAAHLKAEEARREETKKGTIGIGERERKAAEMGKKGFLERIGAKKADASASK